MALTGGFGAERGVEITLGELTGAVGDSITVLPILVALSALTPVSLPLALVFFGAFQIVWGVAYGLPLSVEPMKALAGLAIAGTLGYGEYLAAGLVGGAVLVVAGTAGALGRLRSVVGEPVIRGVQVAVALLLARTGIELGLADPALTVAAAGVVLAVAAVGVRRGAPLVVLGLGMGVALLRTGMPAPALPTVGLFPAGPPTFDAAALGGAAGQLAMTVGNAAVATSLLCADLFDADVSPDRLSQSMGVTCLVAVPLGGLPMCHGSGGLAGKHAFGARTGGANVVLGALYLLAVPFTGVIAAFPTAVLGVLLLVVAAYLGRNGLDAERRWLVVAIGVVGVLLNVGAAFLLGVAAEAVLDRRGA